ncbi:MAG: hypothetical protein AB3N13_01045 [Arenibacterium sp.]
MFRKLCLLLFLSGVSELHAEPTDAQLASIGTPDPLPMTFSSRAVAYQVLQEHDRLCRQRHDVGQLELRHGINCPSLPGAQIVGLGVTGGPLCLVPTGPASAETLSKQRACLSGYDRLKSMAAAQGLKVDPRRSFPRWLARRFPAPKN